MTRTVYFTHKKHNTARAATHHLPILQYVIPSQNSVMSQRLGYLSKSVKFYPLNQQISRSSCNMEDFRSMQRLQEIEAASLLAQFRTAVSSLHHYHDFNAITNFITSYLQQFQHDMQLMPYLLFFRGFVTTT